MTRKVAFELSHKPAAKLSQDLDFSGRETSFQQRIKQRARLDRPSGVQRSQLRNSEDTVKLTTWAKHLNLTQKQNRH